jgi:hypothetical protein
VGAAPSTFRLERSFEERWHDRTADAKAVRGVRHVVGLQRRLRSGTGSALDVVKPSWVGSSLVPDDEGQFIAGVLAASPSDGEPPSFTQRHR